MYVCGGERERLKERRVDKMKKWKGDWETMREVGVLRKWKREGDLESLSGWQGKKVREGNILRNWYRGNWENRGLRKGIEKGRENGIERVRE